MVIGESSAVVPVNSEVDDRGFRVARDWKTISIAHIVELVDIKGDAPPKRK